MACVGGEYLSAQSSQGFLQSIVAKRSNVLVWPGAGDTPVVTWEYPATSDCAA